MNKNIKKKQGRPLLDQEKPLEKRLILRVSPEDIALWKLKAIRKGLKLSAWIRFTLNQADS